MSLDDGDEADREQRAYLSELVDRLATAIMREMKLDGVVLKVHLGSNAAAAGVTSRNSGKQALLDEIVCGEVEAMARYVADTFGAREVSGSITLRQPDGSMVTAGMGDSKKRGKS